MQLNPSQLIQHLKGPLLPVYLISGDVPLLRQEARDAIRKAAHTGGCQDYQRLEVESGFYWQRLTELSNSYNLFAERTLIELHNPATKFDKEAGKILADYCANLPEDKVLLIVTGKLSVSEQKSRWYKSISECGAVMTIWPIKAPELPQWIQNRLHQHKLKADPASIRLLAEFTEGNLLATQQAIIKLQLLYPASQAIGVKEMAEAISDCAQFNVFELGQYILQGDCRSALRVLQHLKSADTEPTLILWLLARECRELLSMLDQLQQGKPLATVLQQQWASLKAFYQSALRRVTAVELKKILMDCQATDQIIKGAAIGNIWDRLTQISLALAGSPCR